MLQRINQLRIYEIYEYLICWISSTTVHAPHLVQTDGPFFQCTTPALCASPALGAAPAMCASPHPSRLSTFNAAWNNFSHSHIITSTVATLSADMFRSPNFRCISNLVIDNLTESKEPHSWMVASTPHLVCYNLVTILLIPLTVILLTRLKVCCCLGARGCCCQCHPPPPPPLLLLQVLPLQLHGLLTVDRLLLLRHSMHFYVARHYPQHWLLHWQPQLLNVCF